VATLAGAAAGTWSFAAGLLARDQHIAIGRFTAPVQNFLNRYRGFIRLISSPYNLVRELILSLTASAVSA
jgi:hypothetical protein